MPYIKKGFQPWARLLRVAGVAAHLLCMHKEHCRVSERCPLNHYAPLQ